MLCEINQLFEMQDLFTFASFPLVYIVISSLFVYFSEEILYLYILVVAFDSVCMKNIIVPL